MKRSFVRLAAARAAVIALPLSFTTHAQIPVGTNGSGLEAFANKPLVTSWSTVSIPGSAVTWNSDGTAVTNMDATIQTLYASNVNLVLSNSTAVIPGVSSNAVWSSANGGFIQTRPSGPIAGVLLLATLTNTSGAWISNMEVLYDLAANVAPVLEEVPGHRLYYSLSGLTNTWVVIGTYDTAGATQSSVRRVVPINIPAGWPPATAMYLLFVDDNAVEAPEGSYVIDNFAITNVVYQNCSCPRLNISAGPAAGQLTLSRIGGGVLQSTTNFGAPWSAVPGNPNPYIFTPGAEEKRLFSLKPATP